MRGEVDLAFEAEIEVLISAIEHYSYCPRQCALIHVEQSYSENLYTTRGNLAHERVDAGVDSVALGVRSHRNVTLWSMQLQLRGKADLVEFRKEGPYPVEYKVGKRQRGTHANHADLQLCAQALCLEEMLGQAVPKGAIYYHCTRRRHEVHFDLALRQQTIAVIEAIRSQLLAQQLPIAPNDERCHNCSLWNICLPSIVGEPARLRGFQGALFHPWSEEFTPRNRGDEG
jgi:CRISPR-associated exonuclease Cas4